MDHPYGEKVFLARVDAIDRAIEADHEAGGRAGRWPAFFAVSYYGHCH
jgi:hypothetical protein